MFLIINYTAFIPKKIIVKSIYSSLIELNKMNMKVLFFGSMIILLMACGSIREGLQLKQIQDKHYKTSFSVVYKPIAPILKKKYYWYKSNTIHQSLGDYSGQLLHGTYIQHYRTNQLAEKGQFQLGVKQGTWKKWFTNGQLKSISYWNQGFINGSYLKYTKTGDLDITGTYRNGVKHGVWISRIKKDTLYYKRGILYDKNLRKSFFKKKFKGKAIKNDSTSQDSISRPSIFKRIFKKKKTIMNDKS